MFQVLSLLTKLISTRAKHIRSLLTAVAALDVAAARAGHARWLGALGIRPSFISRGDEWEQSGGSATGGSAPEGVEGSRSRQLESPLSVPGALHPVLLELSLAPLPEPPSVRSALCCTKGRTLMIACLTNRSRKCKL